jgi:hypothetical protein
MSGVRRLGLLLSALLVMVVGMNQTVSATNYPSAPGGNPNQGVFSHQGSSDCLNFYVCVSPYSQTTNSCKQTSTSPNACHIYNFNGNSSQWAGYLNQSTDLLGCCTQVAVGAVSMRNRMSTSMRTACSYSSTLYGGFTYTLLYATSGFKNVGYTGIGSVAAIPNSISWACQAP